MRRFFWLVSAVLLSVVSFGLAESKEKPYCAAYSVAEGDLYLKILQRDTALECWLLVVDTGEQRISGGSTLAFRYVAAVGHTPDTVLVVKERVTIPPSSLLYSGSPPTVDVIRLYRPKIISALCNNGRLLEAVGKILRSDRGEFVEADLVAYLKYHRAKTIPAAPEIRQFHFEYQKILNGVARCIATNHYASGNRRAYDMVDVRPNEGTAAQLAEIIISSAKAAFDATFGVKPVGHKEKLFQVRHFAIHPDPKKVSFVEFHSAEPQSGTLYQVAITDLEERDEYDQRVERNWSILWKR